MKDPEDDLDAIRSRFDARSDVAPPSITDDEWRRRSDALRERVETRVRGREMQRRRALQLVVAASVTAATVAGIAVVTRQREPIGPDRNPPLPAAVTPPTSTQNGTQSTQPTTTPATSVVPSNPSVTTTPSATTRDDSVAAPVRLSVKESGDVGPFVTLGTLDEPVGLPIGHDVLVLADDATYRLDTDSLTWGRAADPPTPVVFDDGATVWTGSELLLWGAGLESGLAYSAETDSWRVLAEAPIEPRIPNVTGFIDGEFFVWGGVRFDDPTEPPEDSPTAQTVRHFDDAAAYDPKSDTWRRLTSVAPGDGAERIWTLADDTHATVFRTPDGDLQAATYDPALDRWTVDDTTIPGGWDMRTIHAGTNLITLVSTRPPPSDSAVPVLWRWNPQQGWQELPTHPFGESPVICTNQLHEIDGAIVVWWCSQIAFLDGGIWSTPVPLEHGTFIPTDDGLLRATPDTIIMITFERS